jgi:hypothetical protein
VALCLKPEHPNSLLEAPTKEQALSQERIAALNPEMQRPVSPVEQEGWALNSSRPMKPADPLLCSQRVRALVERQGMGSWTGVGEALPGLPELSDTSAGAHCWPPRIAVLHEFPHGPMLARACSMLCAGLPAFGAQCRCCSSSGASKRGCTRTGGRQLRGRRGGGRKLLLGGHCLWALEAAFNGHRGTEAQEGGRGPTQTGLGGAGAAAVGTNAIDGQGAFPGRLVNAQSLDLGRPCSLH